MSEENFHIPVLSHEAIKLLINEDQADQIIADGTLGGGGYTKLICENLKQTDKVISIDKDLNALEHSKKKLEQFKERIIFVNGNFGELRNLLDEIKIQKITGLVLDLGLSSYQLEAEDGFSFMKDTELDMRAFKKDDVTAADILNSFRKEDLTEIFNKYGEIGNPERLSKAITEKRRVKKLRSTFDLVETVREEYKINKKDEIDFLAKIFQALRIKVNRELENLENVLKDSTELIVKGGRIVIVSYHSLEDRIVKNFFKEESRSSKPGNNPFFDDIVNPKLKILTKKPLVPGREEIKFNVRSRSAKLRAAEII
ncbi:MAG TPA: 16S rRNA (cytosine(1402)-N(4))-methyltransferase RsmH [Ignavibacteria bacterium]|nr:16S rRNA (cytosine(1402)-N(4))-methyltransferase RsmH [Ignavibacteria bacterium]